MDFSFLISISDGDQEFINDFIETYESVTFMQVKKMKEDFEGGDNISLQKVAHQVKPTSQMLGFESQPFIVAINKDPSSARKEDIDTILSEAEEILGGLKKEFQS